MKKVSFALALVALAASTSAFAGGDDSGFTTIPCTLPGSTMPGGSGVVHVVGAGKPYATILAAVDAADAYDEIVVHPGVYKEQVEVTDPAKTGLRIRGTDRNTVILDGESTREFGILVDAVDYVVVENMTGHNYVHTAFYWRFLIGYWGRYLTGYNNGLYGLYAYDARCGQFDHSYASGNADSGFYIGECYPCDAVIHNIVAEGNALGYSGTNAGGDLVIRDSIWRDNGLGLVPNTLDSEERPPQRAVVIKNNLVIDNNNIDAPGSGIAGAYWGGGIVLAGGQDNEVYGNVVTDHALGGIVISPLPDQNVWIPGGNTVRSNIVSHDPAEYPNAVDLVQAAASGANNCWSDNVTDTGAEPVTAPPLVLQTVWSCDLTTTPPGGDPRLELSLIEGQAGLNGRVHSPWQTWPAPELTFDQGPAGALTSWIPAVF